MIYSSSDNSKIKYLKKLNNKKYRDKYGEFLIEGKHLVEEAYKCGLLKEVILKDSVDIDIDVDKIIVTSNVLNYISMLDNSSGIIGVCKKKNDSIIGSKILILDDVQDPGNMGTIIRSSVAFNIDTIIVSKNSVDIYNDKVLRSSEGMLFNINIVICELDSTIKELKNLGYTIYGTSVNNGKSLNNIEKCEKFAIIMGNEGNGVKSSLLDLCDYKIHIDMNSSCESLNVAIATSIILYEFNR